MPQPRPTRLNAAALHDLLLKVGIDVLKETGLSSGADHVTLERVIRRADVPRASAYRIWSNPDPTAPSPQDAFQEELLSKMATTMPGGAEVHSTNSAARAAVAQAGDLTLLSPQDRAFALRELIRASANANAEAVRTSADWRVYIGIVGVTISQRRGANDPLPVALRASEAATLDNFELIYTALAHIFGIRIRAPFQMRQFASAAASLADGAGLRHVISPDLTSIQRPTGRSGESQDWSLFAVAFEGLAMFFFEPDPDSRTSTNLAFCYT